MVSARWKDWDGQGLEHCVLTSDAGGLVLEGVVAGTRHGLYGGHYFVRTDAAFTTLEVRVDYVGGLSLHVQNDATGQWRDVIRNRALPALDGCLDVDIGITPATNMLPIKRLKLSAGASAEILAAYVPLPDQIDGDFQPQPAAQRYTCLVPDRSYRYEGLFRAFTADLDIDASGLVLDYPDTFRRVLL